MAAKHDWRNTASLDTRGFYIWTAATKVAPTEGNDPVPGESSETRQRKVF